jgi:hypothetical protein
MRFIPLVLAGMLNRMSCLRLNLLVIENQELIFYVWKEFLRFLCSGAGVIKCLCAL